jgi:hypothetical protein
MKKALIMVLGLVNHGRRIFAQATKDVTMTVTLKAWYDLSLGASAISFDDVQPALASSPATQSIAANEGPVAVRAFAVTKPGDTLELSVAAAADLTDGTNTIGIGAISWTATGTGYAAAGTMAKTDVTAGSWTGSILHWREGNFTFSFLRDYATQAPGTYTATATYTLSVI